MFWIQPLGKQVVVKTMKVEIQVSDLIATPEEQQDWEKVECGQVYAVGFEVTDLAVGQTVFFSVFEGMRAPTPSHKETYVVLKRKKIMGVLDVDALLGEVEKRKKDREDKEVAARESIAEQRRLMASAG
jgi:co-chaperonin GroES (HSP10)